MRRLVLTVTAAATAIVLTAGCSLGDDAKPHSASKPPAGVSLVTSQASHGPLGPNLASPVAAVEAPATFLAVRDKSRLVVVDTATGQDQRLLYELDPQPSVREFDRQFIAGIALSSDGKTAFFSVGPRSKPESRVLYRVAVDGGPVEQIGTGSWPRVSPDGRRVASIADQTVVVQDLATGTARRLDLPAQDDAFVYEPRAVAWAGDSRHLVLESQWRDSLTVLDADTATHQLDGRSLGDGPDGGEYWLTGVRATDGAVGALISLYEPNTDVGEPARTFVVLDPTTGAERERIELPFGAWNGAYDRSGRHLLLVADDGSVHRSRGDGFVRIPGAGATLVAW